MITLKNINLSSIDLSSIDLRGIKLGLGGRGGGSSDGFPQLPGDVTRWHFGGLTNEMMAAMDDPRIEDADGKGRFLSFKNFAWGGMSGVGGYTENYNSNKWYKVESRIDATWTYKSFNARSIKDNRLAQLFYQSLSSDTGFRVLSCTIKVSGLTDGQGIEYVSNGAQPTVIMRIENDGIYHLPSFDFGAKNAYYGFRFLKLQESCNITIEQLPLYPGALVFDGVDDYGVCNNFPILTKEKGYTVVALRQWDQDFLNTTLTGGLLSTRNYSTGEGVAFEKIESSNKAYWNLGAGGIIDFAKSPFTWQTSKQYNNVGILKGDKNHGKPLCVGCGLSGGQQCGRFAIWELVILDHDATEEELTKIKDYFIKTYPWLFPNQAWTVTGKTNQDEDRATIANITGNGNNLVLSNFGFAEGSGYGLYAENYSNSRWFINNSITATKKSDTFNVTSINQVAVQIQYIAELSQSPYTVPSYTIKVTGLTDGQTVNYRVSGGISYPITQDGIYILPGFDFAGMGSWYGFQFNKVQETCDITIEQIPEYEGYLVTDGVDDIASSNTVVYEADFTFIGEWKFIQKDDTVAGINSVSHLYIQNRYNRGATVMINSTFENKKNITDYMTFKAITSKGKAYDENWNEVDLLYGDGNKGLSQVSIGGQGGSDFCHMIFKNMALYMNKVFSKDECIKAYNYLQTLKAK